ncbi:fibronectin type III domain-containing protein [Streptomyces sp. NPDC005760]|uniref:fibronectin type III domain-containing protein n=1 Tax=Streptomyces sp. NPDC005760 TaxID=3156718 RepID=UPI0033CCCE10
MEALGQGLAAEAAPIVVSQGGRHDRTVRSGYAGGTGAGFRGGQPAPRAGPFGTAGAGTAQAAPALRLTADASGAPPVQGLHLTFGADPRTRMTVSWITARPVTRPVVRYGTLEHGFGSSAAAPSAPRHVDGGRSPSPASATSPQAANGTPDTPQQHPFGALAPLDGRRSSRDID